jgi:CBS domain-containing protein
MKTSSIALRVADFLKGYPPFEYMEAADVQRLAALGRVKFHEEGEYIFKEGQTRGPWLYVVQQGTVRIVQDTAHGEELVDMRGEGDLLGVSWFLSEKVFVHSARTETDTLLYALPWDEFAPLARKYPKVSRYLAAYFSLRPDFQLPDPLAGATPGLPGSATEAADSWLSETAPLAERARGRRLTSPPTLRVCEAAQRLAVARQEALVVVDEGGKPLGIVTETDLVNRAATGEVSLKSPVSDLMSRPVLTAPPGLSAGEIVMRMLRNHVRHVIVTVDGTPNSVAIGLIGQRDVQLLYGRLPIALGAEIRSAHDRMALAPLRDRADALLRAALQERAPLSWAGDFISEVDGQITTRLLELAEMELAAEGSARPSGAFCWLALGAEGRCERLLRTYQETALVYTDPVPGEEAAAQAWYLSLAERVSAWLAELGFRASPEGLSAAQTGCCRPLSGWRQLFTSWIENPIEENILTRLPVFDLRAVAGDAGLAAALRQHIAEEIARSPRFIPLAANDSLASLPPLTIFRNSVVDKDGLWWTCIDTRQHALQPLVDTARVFALGAAGPDPLNTSARFLQAARRLPAHRELFENAAEAARVALYHQALAGFRHGDNGQFIRPSELSKIDQEILKGVFRAIVQMIEFTSRHFGLAQAQNTAEPADEVEESAGVESG